MTEIHQCRACTADKLRLLRPSLIKAPLASSDFAITDAGYGVTAAIYGCDVCGLLQCPETGEVLKFYEGLEDPEYENGRSERYLQAAALLKKIKPYNKKSLLDVGAGSGVLVEAAINNGFDAVGIEPSKWLAETAAKRGLPVYNGILPHSEVKQKFSVITLIDVIEHVTDPFGVMQSIHNQLEDNGLVFVVTPDVASLCARILGFRWWHYRIAHISYFNKKTLRIIANRAGFDVVAFSRPGWYFSYPYLRTRLLKYLPSWLLPNAEGRLKNLVIPLNLFDSLLMVCRKK